MHLTGVLGLHRLAATTLTSEFVQQHGLTSHVADSGWSNRSYLDLIINSGARQVIQFGLRNR